MNIEEVRDYCLSLRNSTEGMPFGDDFLVFKIEGKMFVCIPLDVDEPHISLKCSPEYTEQLRFHYTAVEPAWHFNKKYWNTIYLERDMPNEEIKHWIKHSYEEVIAKLPKRIRILYNESEQ